MANPTTMTYGDYSFSPVPFITLKKQLIKSGQFAENIGATFLLTLSGTLTTVPTNNSGGLNIIDQLQDEIRSAFNEDGKAFEIKCGDTTILRTCPRVISIDFAPSNNNWVFSSPYTIELEFDWDNLGEDDKMPPFIESFDESWSVSLEESHRAFSWNLGDVTNQEVGHYYSGDANAPLIATITRTVSVKGKRSFDCTTASGDVPGDMTSAADNALNFINGMSFSPAQSTGIYYPEYAHALSGVINITGEDFTATDHFRSTNVNESDGSVSMTETWIVIGETGINSWAKEDFDINVRGGSASGLKQVGINGTIRGYVEQTWGNPSASSDYSVDTYAYANASGYWDEIKSRVFSRAQLIYEQDGDARLNPIPLSSSISHAPSIGQITYQYEYDDRPCNFISGALSEDFEIADNYPTDVFAKITVLGRPQGPVLQDIGTVTEFQRSISLSCVMPIPTGCSSISSLNTYKPTTQVNELLCDFETELTDSYSQVFKTQDQESWNPKSGNYRRSVAWVAANCSGAVSTAFCTGE